ncbi:MAG: hypothetical protein AAGC77_01070 [Pseudomonadota bacterium]
MTLRKMIFTSAAIAALTACGNQDAESASPAGVVPSAETLSVTTSSPVDAPFNLQGADPLDFELLLQKIPEENRPTYETAEFDPGLGATVVTNLTFSDSDDGEGLRIGRAELYGVDIEAVERVEALEDAPFDAPFETIFEKVRLFEIESVGFAEYEPKLTIGAVEFDQLNVRQGMPRNGSGNSAAFFNAVDIGGLYFKDFQFTQVSEIGDNIEFASPDLRMVGLGGGKLAAIIANDLVYTVAQTDETLDAARETLGGPASLVFDSPYFEFILGAQQRGEIETFEWRKIDLSGLLEYGLRKEEPPVSARDLLDLGSMRMTNVESYINGRRVSSVEEATMSAAQFEWLIPSKVRFDAKNAVYDWTAYVPETDETAIAMLKERGLDKLEGESSFAWDWGADNGEAALDYVATTGGFADVFMDLNMSGFVLDDLAERFESDDPALDATLPGALDGMSVKIVDENAIDAIFAIAALSTGGEPGAMREMAPTFLRFMAMDAGSIHPKLPGYVDAVADFLSRGGTLEAVMAPAEPVPFEAIATAADADDPGALIDLVGLEITHTE